MRDVWKEEQIIGGIEAALSCEYRWKQTNTNRFFFMFVHPATTECTHQHNRLTCRHTTDYVAIDVHENHTYSFSQEMGNSLKMVPARTETCWSG
jgi:hypothetical protein